MLRLQHHARANVPAAQASYDGERQDHIEARFSCNMVSARAESAMHHFLLYMPCVRRHATVAYARECHAAVTRRDGGLASYNIPTGVVNGVDVNRMVEQ